ncbi:MAG: ATP-binding protein, partial [Chloroflexota bacterium]
MYGRTRETTQLLNLIIAERIVLLHSPSGAGKTSLIQAALIPKLKEKNFQVLPVVRVNLDVADTLAKGFECNRYVFSALLSLEEDVPEKEKISADWLAKMSLPEYLEKRYWPEDSPNLKMLIFDQFEEIITLDPTDQSEKEEFFKQVGEALEISSRWALFAIRDDFVASLDPYLLWIPNRMSVNFRLDLLGISAAHQAIQEPARDAGVEFEDGAAEKLVDDLRRVRVQQPDGNVVRQLGPHIEPVQLQVVCFRIWEDPRPDLSRITADDLEELDQEDYSLVDRSLTDYYSRRVIATAGATGTSERAIREWFDRRLITEQGVRGTVLMGADTSGGLDNNAIKLLVDAHLVRAEKRGGATWYELSHDRLLEPIRINNLAWYNENLSLLQRQADLWHEGGRKAGVLLVGEALEEAEQWASENAGELTDV